MGEDEGREEAPGWESQEGSPPLHTHTDTHHCMTHRFTCSPPTNGEIQPFGGRKMKHKQMLSFAGSRKTGVGD